MDELKEWYKESLIARIEALETVRESFKQDGEKVLASIRRIAHSLKGSGGTYGFPEISKAADILEKASVEEIPMKIATLISILKEVTGERREEENMVGILIIDDDESICQILKVKLSAKNRDIYIAQTAAQAEEILLAKPVSLIILDLLLPDIDGRNFLIKLRENVRTSTVPIFVLSALTDKQTKTECFALGIDEFFEKPVDPETFSAAVSGKIHKTAKVLYGMHKDPLTKLLNRSAFSEAYERALAYSQRSKQKITIVMIDLDYFKSVNDTFGHAMGDEVLVKVSEILRECIRKSDIIGRWGGEEFIILLPNTSEDAAKKVMEKTLETFRKNKFFVPGGASFSMTFSAGLVEINSSQTLEESAARADSMLYKAKLAGRNRIITSKEELSYKKLRVLFAEDDEYIARVVKKQLEMEGLEVERFNNGVSALAAGRNSKFDLALIDIQMPIMDGFDLIKNLRASASFEKVPIAIITAMGMKGDIIKGIKLGADDYIIKPFSPNQLVFRIRSLIRKSESSGN
ncbi:MAG: response regulator receiver protein [uncultured bacterium]|nr:MAG: response regulator receiver protein [uncultured bacterium]